MCDSHTKESGTVSTEGLLRDNGDTVSHKSGIIPLRKWVTSVELSKQYNYENESSMTEKETKKWSVHLETMDKCYRDLVY